MMMACKVIGLATLAILILGCLREPSALAGEQDGAARRAYPEARRADQVDDYHGTKVADPYRWREDPDSTETRAWVDAENKVTFSYLEQIPERSAIKERLTKLWNYERY